MNEWKKFLSGIWKLTKGYWNSEDKKRAWLLLITIIALNLTIVYLLVLITNWYNNFYNSLQAYDQDAAFNYMKQFTGLAALYIITAVYQVYLRQMLEINWRRWITDVYLSRWLHHENYYRMQLIKSATDNPDQRISDDLKMFTSMTLQLSLGLLKAVVTLISFIAILWHLSGVLTVPTGGGGEIKIYGYMVWAAVAYAFLGTYLTHIIGRPLIKLNFNQQKYEADFRFSLVRLRENSESVAFYGGEGVERETFLKRFHAVVDNFWQIMRRQKRLNGFTSGYGQLAIIFPFVVALPRYFAKEIQLGGLMQISSAFGRVQDALSFFVDAYASLAEWRAVVDRLTSFVEDMEHAEQSRREEGEKLRVAVQDSPSLVLSNLTINLPEDGRILLKNFSFQLGAGDSLLVCGPSGIGKSTFLRTLAGLWPYAEGAISLPPKYDALFVPQKPYLPLGTLREAFYYPEQKGSEADLKRALALCRLEGLLTYLDRTEDWSRVLSLGEQQRVAFARVLLKKPGWLFLDEATSALDESIERKMYELLKSELPQTTIVSVGHRSTLNAYHKKKLTIEGAEKWSVLQ